MNQRATPARLELEAGPLWWGAIREAVARCRFEGRNVELFEGRGWLTRTFVIRGDDAVVAAIARWAVKNAE